MKPLHFFTGLFLSAAASGQVRSSADYAITTDTLDFGGQTVSSATYSITGSITAVTGVSENDSPVPTLARHGYIGQLYERLGLGMIASDSYPPEESTARFTAVHTNDDGTNDAIPGDQVSWEILNGPLTGISPTGLADTGKVHESTEAVVRGTVFSTPLQLSVYVQDTLADNFGLYADDGIEDAWQKLHFGLENPLAAPLLDPDGDGQDNEFEYVAGLIPTDPLSRFLLRIEPVPGEPAHRALKFSPVFPDRSYTVKSNTILGGPWQDLAGPDDDQQQPERTVTDLQATEPRKFYRVEITKP